MKCLQTLFLPFFLFQVVIAQEFDVREFKTDPTDLAAIRYEKRTKNDEASAIVKVITNIKGMKFDSNLGIVDIEYKDEGYWIYIGPREPRIRLMAEGFLPKDVVLPEPAQSHMVYSMRVTSSGMMAPPTALVRITFRMNQENVYIRSGESAPVMAPGSSSVFDVPKGEHGFRFIKQGFSELQHTVDAQEDQVINITLEPGVPTTTLALPGMIIISSDPPGAEVYLNERRVGVTPYQGRQVAGQYNLVLRDRLHHDHIGQFTLAEGATVNIPFIDLKPRFGYWQVTSEPAGAEVMLDGIMVGATPLLREEITSGSHELLVRAPLYHQHQESFTIEDGDDRRFDITLKEAFGHLSVDSDPPGAEVFIDGSRIGTTPWENPRQPSGRYNIRLSIDLHLDAVEQVTVTDGSKTDRFISLAKNYGTLEITAEGSEIYFGDRHVGRGTWTGNLPPGQYKVRATRSLHTDDEREVYAVIGQKEVIYMSPRPRQGWLNIVTEPFEAQGAEIWINGKKLTETSPAVIPLIMGNYNIVIRKPGYLDESRTVGITEGRERELNLKMQTFQGSMLEQARNHRSAKIAYGTATLATVGAGIVFMLSANHFAEEYKTATTDATMLQDKIKLHDMISYVSFGAAVPLGIMTITRMARQKRAGREVNMAAFPTQEGMLFTFSLRF